MLKATTYGAAEFHDPIFLETDEGIVAFLNAALEDGDPALLSAALGDVAYARDMAQLARETDITRDGLHNALSPTGNPSFGTIQKVIKAFGYRLDAALPAESNAG